MLINRSGFLIIFIFQDEIYFKTLDFKNNRKGVLKMLQLLMKLFCLHVYEYEHMQEIGEHKECRKCGINKSL